MRSRITCPRRRGSRARGIPAVVACGAGLLALTIVSVAPAAASSGDVVSFRDCLANDGTISVPSGVPITIGGIGYAEGTSGLMNDFLLKERTTLTISGSASSAFDLSQQWGAPQQVDSHLWVTRLPDTNAGVVLRPGESFLATYDLTFSRPLLVAFPPVTSSGYNGPYLIREEGQISCQVVAG